MKFLIFLLTLPLLAKELPVSKPEDLGMSTEGLAKIDPAVKALIEDKKLAGCSVLVIRKGSIVYQKQFGFANLTSKKPVSKDTIFRIYSMTKSITSAATLMLFDEGKLALDDPLSKHLPEFKGVKVWRKDGDPVQAKPEPTIKDLLRHTAGFVYGWGPSEVDRMYQKFNPLDHNKSLAAMSQGVAKLPLLFQPGERWVYGINSDILSRVVEAVSGKSFDQFLQEKLFTPLGMTDTGFYVPKQKADRLANVYTGRDGVLITAEPAKGSRFLQPPTQQSGGGGLVSTITDYGRFLQMIANGGTFENITYLKKKTVELMTTNQLPKTIPAISMGAQTRHGTGFGLGFSVRTAKETKWDKHAPVGEYGWGGMASTHYWISPKNDLVVVTMEQTLPYNWNLERTLKPIIYDAIKN